MFTALAPGLLVFPRNTFLHPVQEKRCTSPHLRPAGRVILAFVDHFDTVLGAADI